MEFPWKLKNAIANSFVLDHNYGDTPSIYATDSCGGVYEQPYRRFLTIPLESNIEVPLILVRKYVKTINNLDKPSRIIAPCFVSSFLYQTTADSILISFFKAYSNTRFIKLNTKTECYYGGKGFIFDDSWTPLLALGVVLSGNEVVKKIVHIHPKVFLSNTLICKAILKRFVPVYIENGVFSMNDTLIKDYTSREVEITIDKVAESWIQEPKVPSIQLADSDMINNFLRDSTDDIINQLYLNC